MRKILSILTSLAIFVMPLRATTIAIPNTFTNGSVIDATQMNSNFSTIYNDYNGSINNSNIASNGVAFSNLSTSIQQYWSYRRPNLQYTSATTVTIENGINGTSGQVLIIFPDGSIRTDSTSLHIVIDDSRVAALSGTKQSGIRTGTVSNNTWYAAYAVKATDNTTDIVGVLDTTIPNVTNVSTINSNFGTNGWVYLGLIRVGSNGSDTAAGSIIRFKQSGSYTLLCGATAAAFGSGLGLVVGDTASNPKTFTLTYGTGTSDIPSNISFISILGFSAAAGASGLGLIAAGDSSRFFYAQRSAGGVDTSNGFAGQLWTPVGSDSNITTLTIQTPSSATSKSISLTGWIDSALGGGPNPLY